MQQLFKLLKAPNTKQTPLQILHQFFQWGKTFDLKLFFLINWINEIFKAW